MPPKPHIPTAQTTNNGPTVRAASPAAMKRLIPKPTRRPAICAIIAGAGT